MLTPISTNHPVWALREEFDPAAGERWQQDQQGSGVVYIADGLLTLRKKIASDTVYSNAQIDDYQRRKRRDFLWQPPLRLTVRARFSHDGVAQGQRNPSVPHITGTAGFGFWNDPFMMTGRRWPTLPRALWFFYSAPPSKMNLAMGVAGNGWKAATIDAQRLPFCCLLPTAPFAIPLMRLQRAYQLLWPVAQRAICVNEAIVDHTMESWHTYVIEWRRRSVHFIVDGQQLLATSNAPRGPLGLVIWLDNQYMVVTPQGEFRHGLVASVEEEYLLVDWLSIETLDSTIPH